MDQLDNNERIILKFMKTLHAAVNFDDTEFDFEYNAAVYQADYDYVRALQDTRGDDCVDFFHDYFFTGYGSNEQREASFNSLFVEFDAHYGESCADNTYYESDGSESYDQNDRYDDLDAWELDDQIEDEKLSVEQTGLEQKIEQFIQTVIDEIPQILKVQLNVFARTYVIHFRFLYSSGIDIGLDEGKFKKMYIQIADKLCMKQVRLPDGISSDFIRILFQGFLVYWIDNGDDQECSVDDTTYTELDTLVQSMTSLIIDIDIDFEAQGMFADMFLDSFYLLVNDCEDFSISRNVFRHAFVLLVCQNKISNISKLFLLSLLDIWDDCWRKV